MATSKSRTTFTAFYSSKRRSPVAVVVNGVVVGDVVAVIVAVLLVFGADVLDFDDVVGEALVLVATVVVAVPVNIRQIANFVDIPAETTKIFHQHF